MRQKFNFLEGACPVTSGVKPTQHFIKRTSYQQSNMVVVVWWSGAALQLHSTPLPIRRVRSLLRAPTPGGAPSQLLKKNKTKKNVTRHSRICARNRSQLNANDHNWWTTMPVKRHKKSGAKKKKEKKKMKTLLRASHSDRLIHNPVKLFWILRLITCFNVRNNFTTTNASNILSEFPCSLTKVSHGFNTNKKKIMVLIAMVTAYILTMVLLLQILTGLYTKKY